MNKEWLGDLPDWGVLKPVDPKFVDPETYDYEEDDEE